MLDVKEVWLVSQQTYNDLPYPYHIAISTHDGKTYRSCGFNTEERADMIAFRIMDTKQAHEQAFRESDPTATMLH